MQIFGRPWWSFLPWGSLLYHHENGGTTDLEPLHGIYGIFSTAAFFSYLVISSYTGTFSLSRQLKIHDYLRNEFISNETKRKELYDKIFGPGGFADTNFDKKVDIYEKASAYKKLGLEDFPKQELSLKQLEELVKKYQE
ncbi:hypothetical protein HZA97_08175 [Candidatus Woesearchaeota archaeon]|nr:hypothetical protein [Candidatus Woesearchaeota archaeon]